jgi:predicted lipoprotein
MPVSTDTARILAAAKQLAALKRLVENEIAPALGVNIGFSDADGD